MNSIGVVAFLGAWSLSMAAALAQAPSAPIGAAGGVVAPAPAATDISALLKPIIEKHEVPGMVALVTTLDSAVAVGAAGVRARGSPSEVTIADRFHLGSCTKSMTATLAGMLVQEGKLDWSGTVSASFPELAGTMHEGWKEATLAQLLSNRAGAPGGLDAEGLWARLWTHTGTPGEQRVTLAEGMFKHAPVSPPGEKYTYSNAGFAIAGLMAERGAKAAWEELMQERVFGPLGMTSAGFGAPGVSGAGDPGAAPEEPLGHTPDGRPVPPGPAGSAGRGGMQSRGSDNPGAIGPAGTVHCSIEDWGKYIRLHLRGAALARGAAPARDASDRGAAAEGLLGLTRPTFAKLHTAYRPGEEPEYAMGWLVTRRPWARGAGPEDSGRVLTHSGSNTMWFCVVWVAPERGFAVLVACNQGGDKAARACDDAAGALIAAHAPKAGTK